MPVSVDAAEPGRPHPPSCASATTRSTSATGPHTLLADLGDTIPVALPMQPQVVSPGDVLVAAGVALLLVTGGARRRPGSRRAGAAQNRAERIDGLGQGVDDARVVLIGHAEPQPLERVRRRVLSSESPTRSS